MTKTIKLSKNFEKAIDSLNRIKKLSKEFGGIFSELTEEEKDLVGGLVIGVYSPIKGAPKFQAVSGSRVYCEGLIGDISNEIKKRGGKVPSLAEMLEEWETEQQNKKKGGENEIYYN